MNNIADITLAKRHFASHKGQFGKCLVIAGSAGMLGAACLTASAALRSGAGLVTLAVPKSLQPIVSAKLTCVMTMGLEETSQQSVALLAKDQIAEQLDQFDYVAMGPGMTQDPETQEFVRLGIEHIRKPLVIDADGINALVGHTELLKRDYPTILTPHPGEFARLLEISIEELLSSYEEVSISFARKHNVILVLKVAPVLITDGKTLHYNTSGNPGMATAGSGDVLTGIITGLLGQQLDSLEAAILGAYMHGLAGDLAVDEKGEISLIATDILDFLPKAFLHYQKQ